MKLSELNTHLEGELIGNPEINISSANDISVASESEVSFILEKKYESHANESKAAAFITYKEIKNIENQIVVKNPRKALAQVIELFFPNATSLTPSSEPIGENTTLGKNVVLHRNVTIGKNCKIGDNCVFYPNVTIYDNSEIGNNVIIHAGSVIGSDGYGYYEDQGEWKKVPQVGKIIIQDNVEIGANSTLDRGCIGDTIIKKGTKIDNLVHIAHNVKVGEHCTLTAQLGTTGGAIIGNRVMVGGQAGISTVTVGDNVIIAGKSGVTKDIPSQSFVSGFPAWDHKKELLKEAWLRKAFQKKGRGEK